MALTLTESREALKFRPWPIKLMLSQQTNPCAPLCSRALPARCFFQSASP